MSPLTLSVRQQRSDARRIVRARAGSSTSAAVSIADQVDRALASMEQSGDPSAQMRLLALRARRVKRLYSDLAKAGDRVRLVGDLQETHARALLAYWRAKGNAPSTIKSEWSILRSWLAVLGKPDLVKPIAQYWSDLPRASAPRAKSDQFHPRHGDAALVKSLGEGKDRTHYFVERLCHAFRMSVPEAFTLSAATLEALLNGKRPPRLLRRLERVSQLAPEAAALAEEVKQFLDREGRATLAWSSVTIAQGIRRHENHLAYVRRRHSQKPDA